MLNADGPMQVAGDGVVLREWTLDDVTALVALYDTPEMDRRTPVASPFTDEVARRYVERAHQRRRELGFVQLAITTDGGPALGEVLASAPDDEGVSEMGYAVAAAHRGQGLARRALLALLASLDDRRITRARLLIAPDNGPSNRVAETCGFALTGRPLLEDRRKGRVVELAAWDRVL